MSDWLYRCDMTMLDVTVNQACYNKQSCNRMVDALISGSQGRHRVLSRLATSNNLGQQFGNFGVSRYVYILRPFFSFFRVDFLIDAWLSTTTADVSVGDSVIFSLPPLGSITSWIRKGRVSLRIKSKSMFGSVCCLACWPLTLNSCLLYFCSFYG